MKERFDMTCKDCIHWKACKDSAYEYYGEDAASAYDEDNCCKAFAEICENFSDKSEWAHFPYKPLPLLKDGDPSNTDVYCPSCMEDLSGYYIGNPLNMAVCFNCGEIINITESITREEAENAFAERNKK